MTKSVQISNLEHEIIDQQVCEELAAGATQLVMGEGNLDSEVVFIGEAPGKQEDLQGRPFVGSSGKFLDEMLASIDLTREDVYITNIVKYRPPANRDPYPQEKAKFRPILDRQLAIIGPKLIVTLGRHSGMEFLPSLKISRDHGKLFSLTETSKRLLTTEGTAPRYVLPLYHPAAALYNGKLRSTLVSDFQLIPPALQSIEFKN